MPDFHALLRQHLSNAKLPHEIEEELASHLADAYDAELSAGANVEQALDAVRQQLGDPKFLIHAVQEYKGGSMRNFLRHVLIPGLFATVITTLAGSSLDTFRTNHNFEPASFLTRSHVWFFGPATQWGRMGFVNFDVPLLMSYLLAGAFAAYLSIRLGASRRERLWATLVPAAAPLLLICTSLIADLAFVLVRHQSPLPSTVLVCAFLGFLIGWVILPAIALLVGAAPFLARSEPSEAARA